MKSPDVAVSNNDMGTFKMSAVSYWVDETILNEENSNVSFLFQSMGS